MQGVPAGTQQLCSLVTIRIFSVFGVIRVHGSDDLSEVVLGLGFLGLVLDAPEGGKQQAHQDHDDSDDDEKFDEGEAIRLKSKPLIIDF